MSLAESNHTDQAKIPTSRLIEIQEKSFQKQLDWIRQADKKAQILMGTNLAMVAALLSLTSKPNTYSLTHPLIVLIGVLFPALSLVWCTSATSPRIGNIFEREILAIGRLRVVWRKQKPDLHYERQSSLIFFGHIRRLTLDDYADRVGSQSPEQYLDDLNSQCYANATIADYKYKHIRTAGRLLLFGFLPWALAIYLLRTM